MATQKKAFMAGFTLSTIAFATYLLTNNKRKRKIVHSIKNVFTDIPFTSQNNEHRNEDLKSKIGNPDPCDEGDNNMVSEGSMYSVKYYNQEKE